MHKISTRMRAMQQAKQQEAGVAPPPAPVINNLFDACKAGDVEAAGKMIEEGADVNAKVGAAVPIGGAL